MPNRLQTPCKQLAFWGRKRGLAGTLLTLDFLYSTTTFLTDAPLAQLDRALDFGSYRRAPVSPRHSNVFSRLGSSPSGQEVTE